MARLRVFNLTDVATPELEQNGLVCKPLVVYDTLVNPGTEAEVEETAMSFRDAQYYVSVGAMAIGALPSAYVMARRREQVPAIPVASKVLRRRKG
jgi:hypothetical protein